MPEDPNLHQRYMPEKGPSLHPLNYPARGFPRKRESTGIPRAEVLISWSSHPLVGDLLSCLDAGLVEGVDAV
jgi:hypothetical protein